MSVKERILLGVHYLRNRFLLDYRHNKEAFFSIKNELFMKWKTLFYRFHLHEFFFISVAFLLIYLLSLLLSSFKFLLIFPVALIAKTVTEKYFPYLHNKISALINYGHAKSSNYFWQAMLKEVLSTSSKLINLHEIKWLVGFNRSLINVGIANESEATLLSIVICKAPIRFDVVKFLIQNGARFDSCCPYYMHQHCDFITDKDTSFNYSFRSNLIYYLSESVRVLSFNKNKILYQQAKEEFKEIIKLICSHEQSQDKGAGKANYQMQGGFPLISYMPSRDLIKFLLASGASVYLQNAQLHKKNVLDTLLYFNEYQRLKLFTHCGYPYLSNLKEELLVKKSNKAVAFILLNANFSEQLSDLDKADLIVAMNSNFFQGEKVNFETEIFTCNASLAALIILLAQRSEEIYKRFSQAQVLRRLSFTKAANAVGGLEQYWYNQKKKDSIKVNNSSPISFDINQLTDTTLSNTELRNRARQVLGVGRDANQKTITKAYRLLSFQFHPDKNKSADANKKMSCINKAREILEPPDFDTYRR